MESNCSTKAKKSNSLVRTIRERPLLSRATLKPKNDPGAQHAIGGTSRKPSQPTKSHARYPWVHMNECRLTAAKASVLVYDRTPKAATQVRYQVWVPRHDVRGWCKWSHLKISNHEYKVLDGMSQYSNGEKDGQRVYGAQKTGHASILCHRETNSR